MEHSLGTYDVLTMFEVCLTDRGSEFGNWESLETGINGIEHMSVYYCNPMRSGQKGGIEEVHPLLRMILPNFRRSAYHTQKYGFERKIQYNSTTADVYKHAKLLKYL